MAYPNRLLNDDEGVAVDLHPHWSYFAAPTFALLVAITAGVITLVVTDAQTTTRTLAVWTVLTLILVSAIWVAVRYARWLTTHFVVTTVRVIFRAGLLAKRGIEIPLKRVATVHFNQTILERLVGSGDLLIESGGEMGQQRFTDIRQPDRVQGAIHAQMDRLDAQRVAAAPAGTINVAVELERLEGLLERGTLTPEEFIAQKQRLLDWG